MDHHVPSLPATKIVKARYYKTREVTQYQSNYSPLIELK